MTNSRLIDAITNSLLFSLTIPGYNTPHDRNENSSPGGQTGGHSPANLSYMPMAIQRHSGAAQSIGYHIPNMKEEPNTGANNYPNMNAQQDDMSVRVRSIYKEVAEQQRLYFVYTKNGAFGGRN